MSTIVLAANVLDAAAVPAPPGRIACPFDTSRALLSVECGRLIVPENYDAPARTIEIAFMVVHPQSTLDAADPVLYLSGGPGSPSLAYVEMLIATPQIRDIVVDRDWVFYDQRGTGRSIPALLCPAGEPYLERVRACRDHLIAAGVDLSQYNSMRSARDIEELRKLLGVHRWNLWGTSYGSRLAFAVARDFGASVRAIVHDGPSGPQGQEIIEDFRGAELAIERLLAKCTADAACASTYPDLRTRFLAALPRLRQRPLAVSEQRIGDHELLDFIRGGLFAGNPALLEERIQNLLAYMDAAARGDGRSMLEIGRRMPEDPADAAPVSVQGHYAMGQNLSVECNEERPFESMYDYQQAAAGSATVRALFGADMGIEEFRVCGSWPAGRADPTRKSRIAFDGPQLAFSGELDPSLSAISGGRIEMLYPDARNVVFRNATHAQVDLADFPPASVAPYRSCALQLARRFLADPKSELDTSCARSRELRLVR